MERRNKAVFVIPQTVTGKKLQFRRLAKKRMVESDAKVSSESLYPSNGGMAAPDLAAAYVLTVQRYPQLAALVKSYLDSGKRNS